MYVTYEELKDVLDSYRDLWSKLNCVYGTSPRMVVIELFRLLSDVRLTRIPYGVLMDLCSEGYIAVSDIADSWDYYSPDTHLLEFSQSSFYKLARIATNLKFYPYAMADSYESDYSEKLNMAEDKYADFVEKTFPFVRDSPLWWQHCHKSASQCIPQDIIDELRRQLQCT